MDSGIHAPDVNELAYARGVFGYGYGGDGGSARFAGHASNGVRINSIRDKIGDQSRSFGLGMDTIRNQFEDATRAQEFNQVCNRISQADMRNTDGQFRAELRAADREGMGRIQDRLDDLAKCCCDQKLAAAEAETRAVERFCELKAGQSEIKATLASNKEIAELRQQLTVEQTLNRQYCCPPPVRCVDDGCHGHHHGR